MINDLEQQVIYFISKLLQKTLWDRRKVYEILRKHNVPIASHYFVNRKDTPDINQEYLESLGERQKHRGEELIKMAQEWRLMYSKLGNNNSKSASSSDDPS